MDKICNPNDLRSSLKKSFHFLCSKELNAYTGGYELWISKTLVKSRRIMTPSFTFSAILYKLLNFNCNCRMFVNTRVYMHAKSSMLPTMVRNPVNGC